MSEHEESDIQPPEVEPPPSSPPPPAEPASFWRSKNTWHFVGGFVGWFLVNGLLYWISYGGMGRTSQPNQLFCIILPANVFTFIVLIVIKETRQIGWGMLSAIGLNILISTMIGSIFNAVCMIPFFYPPLIPQL